MGRFILLGSSILFLGYLDIHSGKIGWPLLGIGLLVADIFFHRKDSEAPILSAGLFTQTIAWSFYGTWWMAGLMILTGSLHLITMREHLMQLDRTGIRFSFPWPRRIDWDSVEFLMLKDGLLTLEYKNGRVLQQEIQKDTSLSEADFNEFCKQQCNA
jgi:hypothetical protein